MTRASSTTTSRAQLAAILLVALVSLGGAYLLFYSARDGGLWGTTNKGEFVEPPTTTADAGVRTLANVGVGTSAGADFATDGKWWLWIVPAGPCADACEHALDRIRAIHVLLNRDAERVRRALVTGPDVAEGAASADLIDRYPRLAVLSGNLAVLERGVYIVDPLGNLVFRYPLEDAGEPVLDDLKRLLKVSQIG